MLRREKSGNPTNLMPGDELLVTVNRPTAVTIVQEYDDSPVDAWVAKEWGTLGELRKEIQMLRGQVKHLTWRLENQVGQFNE